MKNLKHYKKNKTNKTPFVITGVVIVAVVISLVMMILHNGDSKKTNQPKQAVASAQSATEITTLPVSEEVTEVATEATTEVATEPDTEPTTVPKQDSQEFTDLVKKGGYASDDLDFDQLIVVDSSGTSAQVSCFQKQDDAWEKVENLTYISGFVGKQGVSVDASEYVSNTPKGLYSIGTGFGICADPGTGLDYFQITENSYWVSDPDSVYYNQHVEGTANKDWNSAEHLIDYHGSYDYCAFIEYNSNPIVAGKGSAFFIHVGYSPTAGCVAIPQNSMIAVLKWLKKSQQPHILIM